MAKKVTKLPAKKPAAKKPALAAKAKAAAPAARQAAPAPGPAKPKAPVLPPRPVPAHQQFLGKGGLKPQHMMKARIIRHQGR